MKNPNLRATLTVLNKVASIWAEEFKYIKSPDKVTIGGAVYTKFKQQSKTQSIKPEGYITTDWRFGNARLAVYAPDKEWLVTVEFDENGVFKESQVFREKGVEYLPVIIRQCKELIKESNIIHFDAVNYHPTQLYKSEVAYTLTKTHLCEESRVKENLKRLIEYMPIHALRKLFNCREEEGFIKGGVINTVSIKI